MMKKFSVNVTVSGIFNGSPLMKEFVFEFEKEVSFKTLLKKIKKELKLKFNEKNYQFLVNNKPVHLEELKKLNFSADSSIAILSTISGG